MGSISGASSPAGYPSGQQRNIAVNCKIGQKRRALSRNESADKFGREEAKGDAVAAIAIGSIEPFCARDRPNQR
jgi:hypothetical protein